MTIMEKSQEKIFLAWQNDSEVHRAIRCVRDSN